MTEPALVVTLHDDGVNVYSPEDASVEDLTAMLATVLRVLCIQRDVPLLRAYRMACTMDETTKITTAKPFVVLGANRDDV